MKLRRYTSLVIPLLVIVPFVVISFYNHPALDDWWYAEVYKQHGLLGAQQYWYNHYTARLFSNFMMTIAPLSFGWIEGYKILPVVFICVMYCTFRFVIKVFFNGYSINKNILALWFTAAYLLIQRDYFESLYWLSANVVYQYTMLFFMLHVTFFYKLVAYRARFPHMLGIVLTGVAITLSNETLGGLVLVEASGFVVYCLYKRQKSLFAFILLAIQLACWAIMFLAPGNWAKINDATQEHVYTFFLGKAIHYTALSVGYYLVFLIKQPSVWCLVLLAVPVSRHLLFDKLKLGSTRLLLFAIGANICIAAAIYFISIYPTGILIPPLRVTNIAIVFLFLSIVLSILWSTHRWPFINNLILQLNTKKEVSMIACLVFAVATPTKYNSLLQDVTTGRAGNYNRKMYERYNAIKNSNTDTCFLPRLQNVPRTIVATDVSGHVSENIGLVFDKIMTVIIK